MSGEQGSEPPTEHRLQEAWKKGDTPQSAELNHAASTLLWALVLLLAGSAVFALFCRYMQVLLIVLFEPRSTTVMGWAGLHLGLGIGSVCIVGLLLALLPDLLQSRGRWATRREWFDMARINPVARLKSVFALPRLLQIPLAFVRFLVVAVVAWSLLDTVLSLVRHGGGPWHGGYQIAWWATVRVLAFSSLVCLGIGLLDALIQHTLWLRRNRMKKDEIQKEFKEQDGDPQVKGLRRQIHQESVS